MARSALLDEEIRLRAEIARVAAMRAALPAGGAVKEDYEFEEIDGDGAIAGIRMSELFENDKNCLFLYGFMYGPENEDACPMCSPFLYADVDGQPRHVDSMWPLWNVFDTTPEGRGTDWYPSLKR
jgi:predicted dithiol-disulfide oxidoreductase (DUF899 family)